MTESGCLQILTRPETVDTGVVKPSLCPVAHLKKYMESASSAAPDANGNLPIVLGPALLGNHDQYRCVKLLLWALSVLTSALRDGAARISADQFRELRRAQNIASSEARVSASAEVDVESSEQHQQQSAATDRKRKRGDQKAAPAGLDEDFIAFGGGYDQSEHREWCLLI